MQPERLRPDNFTPPTRTPWGGKRILQRYKAALELPVDPSLVIGESWEVSVEPSFPSRLERDDRTLAQTIAVDPDGWLGPDVARRYQRQTPLLVKLLDAADNLSVQVHPAENDPDLAADESGKPESWLILEADPGAGLYLGLRDGVTRPMVEQCIREGDALDQLLNFVPVGPGDAFVIEAGTIHAIGGGVTLVEPQHVTPGRRGLTYRYWDWNRLYDSQGLRAEDGQPRQLHLQRSLDVTRWDGPRGEAFVQSCRPRRILLHDGELCRQQELQNQYFRVERWSGTGSMTIPAPGTMLALTCVAGRLTVVARSGSLELARGQSGVIPASGGSLEVRGEALNLVVSQTV